MSTATSPALPKPRRAPRVGLVSLGCPKALVDSERILTQLRIRGYEISPSYADADLVLVNTCGFIEAAIDESLQSIGEALDANGRVIVTGCLGADPQRIRDRHPHVLEVTGPHALEQVVSAVEKHLPRPHEPFQDLVPPQGIRLTPRHYAYLKISEGCNNKCSFCIIPNLRGKLASRPLADVLREAERLVASGTRELLVISQDTSAYGSDLRYPPAEYGGETYETRFVDLARALGTLGVWVRLHYVYPYPHVDQVLPLMAAGRVLPYLDIPFQHASPSVLRAMRRPANDAKVLQRIRSWREQVPELAIRSSFVVGFPGETEEDVAYLLAWLEEAQLDRVGAFKFEPVEGAPATSMDDQVPDDLKQERYEAVMALSARISAEKLERKVGSTLDVLIDAVDEETGGATGRSKADAPEIDGEVHLRDAGGLHPGDIVSVTIEDTDEHDLFGVPVETLIV
jgi:ribosomal protein S12 methylthiotransferase